MKLMATSVARYNCTAATRTKGFGSPAKGPEPRLAKDDANKAAAAASVVHQRGGRRNAATSMSASNMNGMSMIVVTLPGGAENTRTVMPSMAQKISADSIAGADGADNRGARQRTAQPITTGATHKDPSQFPAHQSCHSRR